MKFALAVAVALPALAAARNPNPFASSAQNAYNGYETGYQGNSQYCQVKGFPNQSFKVGCSYQVEGKFNCYDWDKMTLWCTSGGSKGRYVYCCGSACYNLNPPNQCGKPVPPKPPTPPPPPPPGPGPTPDDVCRSGYGKSEYDKAKWKGGDVMRKTFEALDEDCSSLDRAYKNVKKQAPSAYCANKGFIDGATRKYEEYQDGCVSDCAGNGKAMGESLGKQYCAIGALASGPPQRGMTQQICNAVEQTVCETTFEDYAAKYCPNNDPEFFDQLIKSCRFTSS